EKRFYDGHIVPYRPIKIDPASTSLHYRQTIFEELETYVTEHDDVQLFRPVQNMARINHSSEILQIPEIDEAYTTNAIKELIRLDKEWITKEKVTSLYIRPFIIATESHLGVTPAKNCKFIIILSPVGAYYDEGINPIKIAVENKFVRAVTGG